MSDLAEAIRDHLELKRRRGADPAEVAKQEQEALTPATRSHPVVVAAPQEREPEVVREAPTPAREAPAPVFDVHEDLAEEDEDLGDATQEFRVTFDDRTADWLDEVVDQH